MNSSYIPSMNLPPLRKVVMPKVVSIDFKVVTTSNLGVLSESSLMKKIRKIGNRINRPIGIDILDENGCCIGEFLVDSRHPIRKKVQDALVDFLFNYSLKGNIVACKTVKRFYQSHLQLIVSPTNDYSYSNINADVICSLIQTIDWKSIGLK